MFGRRVRRNDAWQGIVISKKRGSPDGQNMYHRLVVTLSDGTEKKIRVRRALWKTVSVGDRIVKVPGEKAPAKGG
ncbi:MAG TPA: hypothetical protein VF070_37865 [Streptosporangiaceae bacterium]